MFVLALRQDPSTLCHSGKDELFLQRTDQMNVRIVCLIDMYQRAGMMCMGYCKLVTLMPALNSLGVRGSIIVKRGSH